jgi:hypothetical protein
MERNFILGAVVVCAVALAIAAALKNDPARDADVDAIRIDSTPIPASTSRTEKTVRQPSSPIEERRDDALLAHVEHKYRYLLADVESAHVDELRRRLMAHEGEENLTRKATTDAHVSEMLSPREREYYEVLKDSDLEQHRVAEYVGGVGNIEPLDQRQERQILDAKLRQKRRYAATLRDAGLDQETLSEAERQYARAQVAAALKGYLDDFLMEVAPSLTSEQYTLLRNYETTEFQRELERLQRQINSK